MGLNDIQIFFFAYPPAQLRVKGDKEVRKSAEEAEEV